MSIPKEPGLVSYGAKALMPKGKYDLLMIDGIHSNVRTKETMVRARLVIGVVKHMNLIICGYHVFSVGANLPGIQGRRSQ